MSTEREQLLTLESLYKEKRYDEFLPLAQQAAQQFPASFHIHLLYGQALVDLKKYKDAEEILLELIKSYPDNINLLLELGRLFQLQQNKDQALEYFNRILFLDPFNSQAKQYIEQIDGAPSEDDIDISREQTEVELIIPEELIEPPPGHEEEVKPATTPVPEDIPEQSFDEVLSEEPQEPAPTQPVPEEAVLEEVEPADIPAPEPVPAKEEIDPLALTTPQPPVSEEQPQPATLDSEKSPPDDTTPLDVIPLPEEQLSKEVDVVEDKVRQIAETEIRQTIPKAETVTASAEEEEAKPRAEAEFVTESAAEIYLQQGHVGEALKIYEQLYQSRKEEYIMEKINKLKIRYLSQKKIDALSKFLDLIQQRS